MIELKNVTKTYELGGEKIYALNNVNLVVNDGAFIAIVGPSGSGKSTLANVIGGLDKPDSGEVMFSYPVAEEPSTSSAQNNNQDNQIKIVKQDIAKANDAVLSEYRNKMIGFIFQTYNLQPNYTALENVMIPLIFGKVSAGDRKKRALDCLKAVGLADRVSHRPNQLSGGQRQRVCIARALANNPKIIIADEPTGNLDSKKSEEIVALLKQLNRQAKITLIVITHDQNIARQASKIVTIKDGKLS